MAGNTANTTDGNAFPVTGGTFVVLLLGTVLLIGALNFVPALTLGPIVEHGLMLGGRVF